MIDGNSIDELKEKNPAFIEESKDCIDYERVVYERNILIDVRNKFKLVICAESISEIQEKWDIFYGYICKKILKLSKC